MKIRFFLPLVLTVTIFTAPPIFADNLSDLIDQGNGASITGRVAEAEQIFRRVIELDPNNAEAHNSLGNSLLRQRKLAEAIASFRTAIRLNPDNANYYKGLASALVGQGNKTEAIETYRTASRLNPDDGDTYRVLGEMLADQGNLDEAISNFRSFITNTGSNNPNGYYLLANALVAQGNLAEAIINYRHALRRYPYNNSTRTKLQEAEQNLLAQGGTVPPVTTILSESGTLGETSQVNAADGTLFATYTFNGQAEQVVDINLTSSDFDTYLQVFSSNEQLLGRNDDISPSNTNSFLWVILPTTGTYTIAVRGMGKTSRGRYNLSVTAP